MIKNILKYTSGFAIVYFIILTLLLAFVIKQEPPTAKVITQNNPSPTIAPTITPKPTTIATPKPTPKVNDPLSELGSHNSQSDCWISYQGHIYNISSYFGMHPGGDATLIKYCGKDATAAFDSKDLSPPKSHSSTANNLLQQYLVK